MAGKFSQFILRQRIREKCESIVHQSSEKKLSPQRQKSEINALASSASSSGNKVPVTFLEPYLNEQDAIKPWPLTIIDDALTSATPKFIISPNSSGYGGNLPSVNTSSFRKKKAISKKTSENIIAVKGSSLMST